MPLPGSWCDSAPLRGRAGLPAAVGCPGRHPHHHRHRRPRHSLRQRRARVVHPEQVASYLAKYLTKATEDFGLPAQVRSAAHARAAGASAHAVRIIATAEDLATPGRRTTACCCRISARSATAATRSPSPAPTP